MSGRARLRLAAVGCGRVFERYHLPAIRACAAADPPRLELVAACEPEPARLDWARSTLAVACFASMAELVESGSFDAALVATPPETHVRIAGALLAAGAHVLVEKPMATSLEDAALLRDAQLGSGRVLRVGFNRRYRASYEGVRTRVRSGGGAREVSFTFVAESARWRKATREAAPSAAFVLHDAGSHVLDLVAHVAGAPIEEIRAAPSDDEGTLIEIEARLAGGITARCLVGQAPRYREALSATDTQGRRHLVDTSGRTAWQRLGIKAHLLGRRVTRRASPSQESFREQMRAFVSACLGHGDEVGAGAEAGTRSVAAVEASLRSLDGAGAWCAVSRSHHATSGKHE